MTDLNTLINKNLKRNLNLFYDDVNELESGLDDNA